MEILTKNLKKTIRSKADEELYDILYAHSQDYTLEALGAAWDEFRHRQLDAPPISRIAASADKALKERAAPYIQFRVGEITYRVSCKEGLTAGSPGENFEGTTKTQITIALLVDEERVFEFEMKKVVRYTPEMPFFSETMGEVTSFIDGPWVTAVPELLQKIIAHENSVLYERQAPQLQHKLREDMKRFGL